MDKNRERALWQRLAADNDFQSWLDEQQDIEYRRLLGAGSEHVFRAQGRAQVLAEIQQHVRDAHKG